jgi:hypothetical protein
MGWKIARNEKIPMTAKEKKIMSSTGWIVLILFGSLYWGQKMLAASKLTLGTMVQMLIVPALLTLFLYKGSLVGVIVTIAAELTLNFLFSWSKTRNVRVSFLSSLLAFGITGFVAVGVFYLIQSVR